jgi:hypothetical protein
MDSSVAEIPLAPLGQIAQHSAMALAYCWDDSVDKEEYEGSQRADYIASPIYEMKFGGDLYNDLYDLYYDKGRQPPREFDVSD